MRKYHEVDHAYSPQKYIDRFITVIFLFHGMQHDQSYRSLEKQCIYRQAFYINLVVGLIEDPGNKFYWENVMATVLREDGFEKVITTLNAFPTYQELVDKEKIIDYVNNNNIEGVLVTRLVDVKEEKIYHPPSGHYYSGAYGYYNHFGSYYGRGYSRGFTTTSTNVLLETNLYQADNQELIWSLSSETNKTGSIPELINSVSKKVLATLKDGQLIQK